jgi:hypothetical protein
MPPGGYSTGLAEPAARSAQEAGSGQDVVRDAVVVAAGVGGTALAL